MLYIIGFVFSLLVVINIVSRILENKELENTKIRIVENEDNSTPPNA